MRKSSLLMGLALAGLTLGFAATASAQCPSTMKAEGAATETKAACPFTAAQAKSEAKSGCSMETKSTANCDGHAKAKSASHCEGEGKAEGACEGHAKAGCEGMDPAKCGEHAGQKDCSGTCDASKCTKSTVSHASAGIWTFVDAEGNVAEPSADQVAAIREALASVEGPQLNFASVEAADPADLSKGFRARPVIASAGMRAAFTEEAEQELRKRMGDAKFEDMIREVAPNWRQFGEVEIIERPDGVIEHRLPEGSLVNFAVVDIDKNGNASFSCVTNKGEAEAYECRHQHTTTEENAE
ncbi:hypothetical protein KQI84_01235 [bacterium]|nr:hypothetical protein [bacterium]